jgi:hypothetical protein
VRDINNAPAKKIDHKEQIIIFLYKKVQEINRRLREEDEEINKRELVLELEMVEDMLRDYFNLSN